MRAIGIILAGGKRSTLGVLTKQRNVAAMPVGGSYRAIDFALSNLSNSGIKKVAVIAQYSARSLADHIGSSKWWDFGRKKSGLFYLHLPCWIKILMVIKGQRIPFFKI